MSPEKARVCIIDDDPIRQEMIAEYLEIFGHQVLLTALSLQQALAVIPRFKGTGINTALVDGNLTKKDDSGSDGARVTRAIRTEAPEVKIVGISGSGHVEGVDMNYNPIKDSLDNLAELVKRL